MNVSILRNMKPAVHSFYSHAFVVVNFPVATFTEYAGEWVYSIYFYLICFFFRKNHFLQFFTKFTMFKKISLYECLSVQVALLIFFQFLSNYSKQKRLLLHVVIQTRIN